MREWRKGADREREFAHLFGGERRPLSAAAGDNLSGDVLALGLRWEVKACDDGFKQLHASLHGKDALAVRADRQPWLVVIPLDRLRRLLACEYGRRGGRPQAIPPAHYDTVLTLRSQGLGYRKIANSLNAAGVSVTWPTVRRLLKRLGAGTG